MKLLHSQKINKEIKEDFFYFFETNEGVYLIEVIAKAKSWWQNFKSFRSFFKDDDIILYLDNTEIFTSNSKDIDVKAIWNGNELKGLSKIVLVATILKKGGHTLRLRPDQSPSLESINIMELEEMDNQTIIYSPLNNNPPEKGDRRPWINYVLQNLAIKKLHIVASANKLKRDDDDIKVVVDGKVEENENKNSHKDWYWCGKMLKGNEREYTKELNLGKGKHFIELWADKSPTLKKIEIMVLATNNSNGENNEAITRLYTCGGVGCKEDYNRYDAIIAEAVTYWNNEFLKDTDPPSEFLDPNLVKAIMYQESRVGFDKMAGSNVMQVGNGGDPSILTLRGELPEYWIHNGKTILLKYDAKVETVKDSINWGVRWLYHKAQGITPDNKRYWKSWQEAVLKYGPGKQEYVDNVWNIYKKGVKKDKKLGIIRLWSILLIMILPLFLNGSIVYSLENKIKDQIVKGQSEQLEDIELTYSQNKKYFLAQIEWERDWWEEIKVGNVKNKNINWLPIDKLPGEQAILSARFISLEGFGNPLVEIYGLTHVGHGSLYIYEIKNDKLNLLFETHAVDINPDIKWSPDNFKKYGYGNCGEIFSNDKLASEYKDTNKDGNSDLILSGTKKIICEIRDEYLKNTSEITVSSAQINNKILWNKNEHTWINTASYNEGPSPSP
ncbi:MAG: hypothetical protein PHY40_01070 [Patescibacteria group bacterium]|nr:hypothetical protein [Patescibacteria group bacterium]